MTAQLLYIVDPMCAWCYGFAPALQQAIGELAPGTEVNLVMGGLAPDSEEPMPLEMQGYVQSAWHAVEARTGVSFNHDFWQVCAPRRSTYPACRAVIVAREAGLGWQMLAAVQRAYYQEARNPSDVETLVELAVEIGLDAKVFQVKLLAAETEGQLRADFALRDQLGASSFPSLGLQRDDRLTLTATGCLDIAELRSALRAQDLLA